MLSGRLNPLEILPGHEWLTGTNKYAAGFCSWPAIKLARHKQRDKPEHVSHRCLQGKVWAAAVPARPLLSFSSNQRGSFRLAFLLMQTSPEEKWEMIQLCFVLKTWILYSFGMALAVIQVIQFQPSPINSASPTSWNATETWSSRDNTFC